ncbi:MAG: hypothetical protein HQ478_07555 [Chloroflexi bacterium]|nr:hypothetical protein [Chloroflexota bacterium]
MSQLDDLRVNHHLNASDVDVGTELAATVDVEGGLLRVLSLSMSSGLLIGVVTIVVFIGLSDAFGGLLPAGVGIVALALLSKNLGDAVVQGPEGVSKEAMVHKVWSDLSGEHLQ